MDVKAVIEEQLNDVVDAVRQALRPGGIFYQTLEAQPDQNRMLLKLRDAAEHRGSDRGDPATDRPRRPHRHAGIRLASTPDARSR